jgi:GNAT superfamily N-acetyltransferase
MTTTSELLAAYDAQLRGGPDPLPAGVREERDGPLLRVTGLFRGFLTAPADLGGVRGAELDALIARQCAYFTERGESAEWKIRGHDQPADLPEWLRAAGFVPEEPETVLVAETAEQAARDVPEPTGVTIRQVTDREGTERVAAMESEVWGMDMSWMADDLYGRLTAGPDLFTVLAAEDDATGRTVSAAWLAVKPKTDFSGLWGGSTLAAWRGRGIYRALVAHRARRCPTRYLQVDASADSAPILGRLGFQPITTTTPYVFTPGR